MITSFIYAVLLLNAVVLIGSLVIHLKMEKEHMYTSHKKNSSRFRQFDLLEKS